MTLVFTREPDYLAQYHRLRAQRLILTRSRLPKTKTTKDMSETIKDVALADHGLTLKRQAFVLAYLENGGNATAAYRHSHNCENMSDAAIRVEACRLLKHPNVTLTIESFRNSKIADTLLTLDEHMAELRDLRDFAKAGGHLSAAVKAEELRGKLRGFYVERVEHDSTKEFANMTTEELYRYIAEEAQALGMTVTLPPTTNGSTKH